MSPRCQQVAHRRAPKIRHSGPVDKFNHPSKFAGLDADRVVVKSRFQPGEDMTLAAEIFSVLTSAETGVTGAVIWVCAGEPEYGQSGKLPRIYVVPGTEIQLNSVIGATMISLRVPAQVLHGKLAPRLTAGVCRFVEENVSTLLSYWNNEISTCEMLNKLRKVR